MSILNVCDVVVVVDSKSGVYKLVSLNQLRVTLISGRKARSSAGKTQSGSSRLHVPVSSIILYLHTLDSELLQELYSIMLTCGHSGRELTSRIRIRKSGDT
jgi:hypothetical protein